MMVDEQTRALAPQDGQRLTAVQAAARDRQTRLTAFIGAATANQAIIERSLKHHGLTFDFFMAAMEVGLRNTMKNDPGFFELVGPQSFLEAVLKATHFGLLPDGKEGAIVRYGSDAAFLPMVEGFAKILWNTGLVVEINSGVVCEGDDFDFQEGDTGYVTHRRSLKRAANAETIGAWCVIKLKTGGKLIEVVDQVELEKIARVSRATKGPRVDWSREMHRKAPFRRIVKRMPKTAALSDLIFHDDTAYDLAKLSAPEATAPAIPRTALFSDRAHIKEITHEKTDTTGSAGAEDTGKAGAGPADAGGSPADDHGPAEGDGSPDQAPVSTIPADIIGWSVIYNQSLENWTDPNMLKDDWSREEANRAALKTESEGIARALHAAVQARIKELRGATK